LVIYACRRKDVKRVVREARDWTRFQCRPRLLDSRSGKSLVFRESRRAVRAADLHMSRIPLAYVPAGR
jgi:hypothetical protein